MVEIASRGFGWHNWVREHAERTPEAPAIIGPTETMSFKQLYWRARKYALALTKAGIKRGDIVVIRMPREPDAIFTLALSMIGAASASNTAKQYYDFEPITDWLLTRQPVENYPSEKQVLITPIWIQRALNDTEPFEPVGFAEVTDLVRLIFTSGTTGIPKAVPFNFEQVDYRQRLTASQQSRDGSALSLFDMGTAGGFSRAVGEWLTGTPYLHMGEKKSGQEIVSLSKRTPITRLHGSPAQVQGFLSGFLRSPFDFSHLKQINVAGASVPVSLQRWVKDNFGITLSVRYGSTEGGQVAFRDADPDLPQEYVGPISKLVELQIVDEAGKLLPDGDQGIVRYKRQGMATHYFRNPEATAKFFKDGWFYPGDLGWVQDGGFYVGGRASEVLNLGGVKIDPALLDDVASVAGGYQEVAVYGFTNRKGMESLGVAVVPQPGLNRKDAERAVAKALKQRYRISSDLEFVYLSELPRGQTGKVLRRELSATAERR